MDAIIFVVLTVGVGSAIYAVSRAERRRREGRTAELAAAAEQLGWGFRPAVEFRTIPDLDRFELFRTGSQKKLANLMTSPAGTVRAVLFDYAYTVSTGKSSHTARQTVYYATADGLDLPEFSLRPEHFFHRVGGIFGYQDIDLDAHPEFSRLFLLRGSDEPRLQDVFAGAVAQFFELRPGCCAAGTGREVLFWRPNVLATPQALEPLVRDGSELVQRLVQAQSRS